MKIHKIIDCLKKQYGALFILPSFLGVGTFFLVPILIVMYYSCLDNTISKEFVFMDNYIMLLSNNAFKLAVKNTVLFTGISVPLLVVISLLTAIAIDKVCFGKRLYNYLLLSTMIIPIASVALIWKIFFDSNGVMNTILEHFGFQMVDWLKSDWGLFIAILLFLWKNVGYTMVLFIAALKSVPSNLIEAAKIDGAGESKIFFRIKIPYLLPTILFAVIISVIASFKVFREVYILTGDYPYETMYLLQHFMNNAFINLDYQKLGAAAVLMCIVISLIILVLFKIDDVVGRDLEG